MVRKVWNGRANLAELDADGPAILSLSQVSTIPPSYQWSLNSANVEGGSISMPTVGECKDGAASSMTGKSSTAAWSLSVCSEGHLGECIHVRTGLLDDGGRTWEVNWIAVDTRIPDPKWQ